jgi:FMN reductase
VSFTVVVGNPKPQSRTFAVASAGASALSGVLGLPATHQIVDLSVLARRLLLDEPSAAIDDAVQQVLDADLLLVVSPTFKGTYSGLLKVFLDRLPYRGLTGATALPVLVMNSPQHALRGRRAPAPAACRTRRQRPRARPGPPGIRSRSSR